MPDIPGYAEAMRVVLEEAAKYFALLLFSVLSIRLWRLLPGAQGGQKRNSLLLACFSTVIALAIGFLSVCHSLSLLYYYFGSKAFAAGNLLPAASLFHASSGYWKNANAVGKEGVTWLVIGKSDQGVPLLNTAKSLRGGHNSTFEEFYEGTYYFFQGQLDQAVPLLEAASADPEYQWNVTTLLSVVALDRNQPADARRLMAPYAQVAVADDDNAHAYVAAALALSDGKPADARSILDRFPADRLSTFWQPKFEKLRARLPN